MKTAKKWIRTKSDEAAIADGCYFDLAAAKRVKDFFERFLVHNKGKFAGKPFELLPWQWENIIAPLFGWKQADGRRRFRMAYIGVPKKNGKSALIAGIALYLLIADGEPGSEVYGVANDREQAAIVYRDAAGMVRKSEALSSMIRVMDSTKTLVGPGGAFYKALSAEAGTKDGINAHGIIYDELHASKSREMWDVLRYAGSSRQQPLHISITTAGDDLQTICGEQYQYAKRILGGEHIDTQFFACVYEASPQDDWTKESTWKKANPSYGITLDPKDFRGQFLEAHESPAKENAFKRFKLDLWIQNAAAWLSMEKWDLGDFPIDLEKLAGRECYAGLDLSATDDTTAMLKIFPEEDGSIIILPRFWLPEDNIDKLERLHKVPYRAWARQGLLELTPGNVVDYKIIRKRVQEDGEKFVIKELAIDRKFQGQSVETDLIEDGFNVTPAGQGWISQDLPAKEIEKLVLSGKIIHGGHPVMRWHAGNTVVDIDKNGNYSINKKRSRSKIDGMIALAMAVMCKLTQKVTETPYYETNGCQVDVLE